MLKFALSFVPLHAHNYYIQARFALLVVEFVSRASTHHHYQDGNHCVEQNHTRIHFAMKTPSSLRPRHSYHLGFDYLHYVCKSGVERPDPFYLMNNNQLFPSVKDSFFLPPLCLSW